MKIQVKSKKGLRTILSVIVDKKNIQLKMDEKLNELQKEVALKGFRPGKVPPAVIKSQFGKSIYGEVVDKILRDTSSKAIEEKKLKVAGQPKIDLKKYEKNEPIEVEIKIDLEPDIKLTDFKKLKVNEYEIDLDNKLVEDNYKELLKSQKKYSEIKNIRQIKKSDKVQIHMSSKDEGVPDFLKLQKNLPIITDSDYQILPSIGDKLIENKLKKGDKIYIEGRIKTRKWTDDKGMERYSTEIQCNEFTFLTPKGEQQNASVSQNTTANGTGSEATEAPAINNGNDDLPF